MKNKINRVVVYVLLILGAVIMIFPFFWMVSSSFKTFAELNTFPPQWLPSSLRLDNYVNAFQEAPFVRYFINSVYVTAICVAGTAFTTILAAFAFSRLKFPGRDILFSLSLSLMMLPFEMLVITNYSTITKMGLYDSMTGLWVPFLASIFYTYILRNFFLSIPDSLYYSARIDGASNWQYLWRIMVPIAKPSIVTIVLLNAISSWNAFLWPRLIITTTNNRTLPFGLYAFMSEGGQDYGAMMAAATVTILPMVLLFLFARKYIVNGVARGGLKG